MCAGDYQFNIVDWVDIAQVFDANGKTLGKFGSDDDQRYNPNDKDSDKRGPCLVSPSNLALDKENNVFVTDTRVNRVFVFTAKGEYITHVGRKGQLSMPESVSVDVDGKIYVSSAGLVHVFVFRGWFCWPSLCFMCDCMVLDLVFIKISSPSSAKGEIVLEHVRLTQKSTF